MDQFKIVVAGIATFLFIIGIFATAVQIEQTERGIVTKFGAVTGVMDPGFHLVNPFTTDVKIMDVSVQALPVIGQSYSLDSQTVDFEVTINYQQDGTRVEDIYNSVQRSAETTYVIPRANDAIRAIFAKYTAQGIVDNLGIIPSEIKERLIVRLADDQIPGIIITGVTLNNHDFDDAYETAVRNKQVQEQGALAEVNITKQKDEKKKQAILEAEGLAEKTRLEVEALSIANSEKIIDKILAEAALERAKRWNGVLPVNVYGSAPLPFLDVE